MPIRGTGIALDLEALRSITSFATGGLIPDVTFLLDLPAEEGLTRRKQHGGWNRLDAYNLEFHQRVRDGYLALASAEPDRWVVLDGRLGIDPIQQELRRILAPRLPTPTEPPPAET